jgi:peptide/nickel transport system permease protein
MNRKERLSLQFDRIREREEAGLNKNSSSNRMLKKLLNNKLSIIGLVFFTIILLSSIFAPIIAKYDPLMVDMVNVLKGPSREHILGTDKIGRDIFARILYGGRISILVGFGSAIGNAFLGVILGTYAGYKGRKLDAIILKISEITMSFPQMVLVLLLVTILGQSLLNLIIIFIITGWGSFYRMARSQMLSIREEEYVQALRAFGLSDFVICFKHMLPNAISPLLVNITLSTAMFILEETALSFLGLGVPLQIPTWGNILNVAQDQSILLNNWWIWLPVGIVISIFVMSINFIGDGLRDASDPSQQG